MSVLLGLTQSIMETRNDDIDWRFRRVFGYWSFFASLIFFAFGYLQLENTRQSCDCSFEIATASRALGGFAL
jgi:hypothetical protein